MSIWICRACNTHGSERNREAGTSSSKGIESHHLGAIRSEKHVRRLTSMDGPFQKGLPYSTFKTEPKFDSQN